MNVHINQLVKSLLQKDSIEQCSLQELQHFADSNPHFGAAQLLLTKKLKIENSDRYNDQLQKTFLYFHNPMWVEHLLNETTAASPELRSLPSLGSGTSKGGALASQNNTVTSDGITSETQGNTLTTDKVSIKSLSNTLSTDQTTEILSDSKNPPSEGGDATLATEKTIIDLSEPKAPPREGFGEAVSPPEGREAAPLLFEPYHTIDYFASQGIKLKDADKGTDKFSQQLRSFTDWLKTMKKIPAAEIAKQAETVTEKKVEQMAAHSLQDGDVVTEAMAEVWVKQGNITKAIDLYSKLSLQEPAKSVYFAAKIEELKKQL
jgi:hypothetical protein